MLAFVRRSPAIQSTVAMEQRKKTASIAGKCDTCLTKALAIKKHRVERNIDLTPGVMYLGSKLKLGG